MPVPDDLRIVVGMRTLGRTGTGTPARRGQEVLRGFVVQTVPVLITATHPSVWCVVSVAAQVLLTAHVVGWVGPRLRLLAQGALHLSVVSHGIDLTQVMDGVDALLGVGVQSIVALTVAVALRRWSSHRAAQGH
jgi:hypothetical protein